MSLADAYFFPATTIAGRINEVLDVHSKHAYDVALAYHGVDGAVFLELCAAAPTLEKHLGVQLLADRLQIIALVHQLRRESAMFARKLAWRATYAHDGRVWFDGYLS